MIMCVSMCMAPVLTASIFPYSGFAYPTPTTTARPPKLGLRQASSAMDRSIIIAMDCQASFAMDCRSRLCFEMLGRPQ